MVAYGMHEPSGMHMDADAAMQQAQMQALMNGSDGSESAVAAGSSGYGMQRHGVAETAAAMHTAAAAAASAVHSASLRGYGNVGGGGWPRSQSQFHSNYDDSVQDRALISAYASMQASSKAGSSSSGGGGGGGGVNVGNEYGRGKRSSGDRNAAPFSTEYGVFTSAAAADGSSAGGGASARGEDEDDEDDDFGGDFSGRDAAPDASVSSSFVQRDDAAPSSQRCVRLPAALFEWQNIRLAPRLPHAGADGSSAGDGEEEDDEDDDERNLSYLWEAARPSENGQLLSPSEFAALDGGGGGLDEENSPADGAPGTGDQLAAGASGSGASDNEDDGDDEDDDDDSGDSAVGPPRPKRARATPVGSAVGGGASARVVDAAEAAAEREAAALAALAAESAPAWLSIYDSQERLQRHVLNDAARELICIGQPEVDLRVRLRRPLRWLHPEDVLSRSAEAVRLRRVRAPTATHSVRYLSRRVPGSQALPIAALIAVADVARSASPSGGLAPAPAPASAPASAPVPALAFKADFAHEAILAATPSTKPPTSPANAPAAAPAATPADASAASTAAEDKVTAAAIEALEAIDDALIFVVFWATEEENFSYRPNGALHTALTRFVVDGIALASRVSADDFLRTEARDVEEIADVRKLGIAAAAAPHTVGSSRTRMTPATASAINHEPLQLSRGLTAAMFAHQAATSAAASASVGTSGGGPATSGAAAIDGGYADIPQLQSSGSFRNSGSGRASSALPLLSLAATMLQADGDHGGGAVGVDAHGFSSGVLRHAHMLSRGPSGSSVFDIPSASADAATTEARPLQPPQPPRPGSAGP